VLDCETAESGERLAGTVAALAADQFAGRRVGTPWERPPAGTSSPTTSCTARGGAMTHLLLLPAKLATADGVTAALTATSANMGLPTRTAAVARPARNTRDYAVACGCRVLSGSMALVRAGPYATR
jgi:hypothetical protein